MRMFRKHPAVTVVILALVLAFGLPALVGDGTGNYPDVREEIIDTVFSRVQTCRDNPIQRLYTLRSRLVHLAYTEIPVEEREPFVIPSPLPALLYIPPTFTIENAIMRNFTYFAIPLGYSQVTDRRVRCATRLVDLSVL